MKKRILCAVLAGSMMALVGCGSGSTPAEPETAPVAQTEPAVENTEAAADETETLAPETEPLAEEVALPKVSGTSHGLDFELVGCDFTESRSDENMLRLWFNVVNNSEDIEPPSYISAWDGLLAYQNEEELSGSITKEDRLEDRVGIQNILPGVAVQYTETFNLISDTDMIHVVLTTDDDEITFDIDPKNAPIVIPEPVVWATIDDFPWFEPESDEYFDDFTGVNVKIVEAEVLDGKDWMSRRDAKVLRVIYDAENTSDVERYVSGTFEVFQDGVELKLGTPPEKDERDISINVKFQPGEHREIAVTYEMYNETSPLLVLYDDFGTYYGRVFEAK